MCSNRHPFSLRSKYLRLSSLRKTDFAGSLEIHNPVHYLSPIDVDNHRVALKGSSVRSQSEALGSEQSHTLFFSFRRACEKEIV